MISDHDLALIAKRAYSEPATLSIGDAHVLVVEGADPDAVVIAFRGTNPTKVYDILADVQAVPSRDPDMEWVHGGFLWDINCVFDRVLTAIGTWPVILTGHSKGAGEATLMAARLRARGFEVRKLSVFGCPRLGFKPLRDLVAMIPGTSYRHGADPVTQMPAILKPARPNVAIGTPTIGLDPIPDHAIDRYIAALAVQPATDSAPATA
jgi:hypothetical protein